MCLVRRITAVTTRPAVLAAVSRGEERDRTLLRLVRPAGGDIVQNRGPRASRGLLDVSVLQCITVGRASLAVDPSAIVVVVVVPSISPPIGNTVVGRRPVTAAPTHASVQSRRCFAGENRRYHTSSQSECIEIFQVLLAIQFTFSITSSCNAHIIGLLSRQGLICCIRIVVVSWIFLGNILELHIPCLLFS